MNCVGVCGGEERWTYPIRQARSMQGHGTRVQRQTRRQVSPSLDCLQCMSNTQHEVQRPRWMRCARSPTRMAEGTILHPRTGAVDFLQACPRPRRKRHSPFELVAWKTRGGRERPRFTLHDNPNMKKGVRPRRNSARGVNPRCDPQIKEDVLQNKRSVMLAAGTASSSICTPEAPK